MIRIRHPNGVATVTVDPSMTFEELQSLIYSTTDITPENQELKAGFPPKSLPQTITASTPLSDPQINIKKGDQLIISQRSSGASIPHAPSSSTPAGNGATPLPSVSMASKGEVKDGAVYKLTDDGYLTLKVVPDDNSCLFNSIGCLFKRKSDAATCMELRQVIASAIRADPVEYCEPILGYEPEVYIKKILNPNTWGGGIELRIFSEHFQVEINSVDIATGRIDRYGEEKGYAQKVFVVYSGIHYDALLLLPTPEAPLEFATTSFDEAQSDRILPAVTELVGDLKKRKYYTDTATFTLLCKQCGEKLVGEKGIAQHSMSTGHSDFQEYS